MKRYLFLLLATVLLLSACSANQIATRDLSFAGEGSGAVSPVTENAAAAPVEPAAPADGGAATLSLVSDEEALAVLANHDPIELPETDGDVIEIRENFFIAQTNDMYLNTEDYLGKTIKYEGIFVSSYYEAGDETIYYVIRYGPGCCGFDDNAGFEVIWDGDYPAYNDWVEVVGVLEIFEENGWQYLRVRLTSLTVLDERGAEYVLT